jgi:SEL1 protein
MATNINYSRESFDLVQLQKGSPWTFAPESKVTLVGAHGSEIVRSFCFLDSVSVSMIKYPALLI